jgi:hypothetical protein
MIGAVPLRNRVLPTGEIVADPGRGQLMGNRGCLHGAGRDLGVARWRSPAWICCVTEWRGWQRDPMPPGRWTALFFLDEATALAAGHRPCAYCRRGAFLDYANALAVGGRRPRAPEIDRALHAERVDRPTRRQVTRVVPAPGLPASAMVRVGGEVCLVVAGGRRRWSWAGYGPVAPMPAEVELLTPPTSVRALSAGYRPVLHPSAL